MGHVIAWEADTLPQSFTVSASGHISVPVAGNLDVRGKTTPQVERAIAGRGYTQCANLAEARLMRPGPDGSTVVSYVPGGYLFAPGTRSLSPNAGFRGLDERTGLPICMVVELFWC
jgi:protein involved in polysaccharide export with SLBB domain